MIISFEMKSSKFTSLLAVVHLCPAVPTAAKKTAGIANVRSASSRIIIQLFPPNSNIVFPKRACTVCATCFPTWQEPVNETSGILLSSQIDFPISVPPQINDDKPPGNEFRVKTRSTIFVVAILVNGVVGAPFLD